MRAVKVHQIILSFRYDNDGFFPVVPGYKRALSDALKRAEIAGHQVVPFQPPDLDKAVDQWFCHVLADRGKNALQQWEGEILDQSIEVNQFVFKCPIWLRRIILNITGLFSPLTARGALAACSPRSVSLTAQFWDSMQTINERIAKILEKMNQEQIDVILAPGFAYPGIMSKLDIRYTMIQL